MFVAKRYQSRCLLESCRLSRHFVFSFIPTCISLFFQFSSTSCRTICNLATYFCQTAAKLVRWHGKPSHCIRLHGTTVLPRDYFNPKASSLVVHYSSAPDDILSTTASQLHGLDPVKVVPVQHWDYFCYTAAFHWLSSLPQYTQWWSHNSSTPHFQPSYNAVSHFLVGWDGGNINRALDEPYKAYFMHTHSAGSQRTSQSA